MRKITQISLPVLLTSLLVPLLASVLGTGLFAFHPAPAKAQGETITTTWTFGADTEGWTATTVGNVVTSWEPPYLGWDDGYLNSVHFKNSDATFVYWRFDLAGSLEVDSSTGFRALMGPSAFMCAGAQLEVYFTDSSSALSGVVDINSWGTPQWLGMSLADHAGKSIDYLIVNQHSGVACSSGSSSLRVFEIELSSVIESEPPSADLCPLVENAHFAAEEGWLIDGTAVITAGTLTLGPGDIAAQNLTLQASRTYSAVISTTSVFSGSTNLNVVLGTDSETLTIEEAGRYTTTFTTPSNLAGPIEYSLENEGSESIGLDFTCVFTVTEADGQGDCIAPVNGTFENESGWNWYRGATLFEPGQFASLPLADNGMIGTSETYTMPTLAEGEHLLLGFTARGLAEGGVVSGQISNGTDTAELNYSTYLAEYSYEASLDNLAEETGVQLSFVNPGDVITDVLSTADVVMDNVCIFVADRGPNLPAPVDPDGITPIDPGLGFSSCADLNGIWAGFGVNMAQYRADYEAGTAVWDPLGWVPWLIAAIFVTLADWVCFFYATYLTIMDLITYFLNSVMNIGNWFVRMWPLFVAWLSEWNNWLAGSLANIANEIGNTLAAWSDWIGNSLWATSETIALTLAAAADWLGNSLANLSDWIGATLAALWAWLYDFFANFPGLWTIINWLIDAWNLFIVVLGTVIGEILDTLIGIWNDSLQPFLAAVWDFISGVPIAVVTLLIDIILAAWDLLYMMFVWLWENVISVAHLPLTFYRAFDDGINADPYGLTSCIGGNFWCTFLAGVQLINQLIAHSTLYPIVIVGIIISTLWILWDNIRELFFSPIEIR